MGLILEKTLSANDTGATGTHQAGVLIPKRPEALAVFPRLDSSSLNPRHALRAIDEDGGAWPINLIYYNNRCFGGTRNEFRLTGVGPYLRARKALAGDVLQIERRDDGAFQLSLISREAFADDQATEDRVVRLRLTGSWRLVKW